MKNKILIIDGHSIIFKVYFSFIKRPLLTKNGENVSILHGFCIKLLSILDKTKPDYLVIVFDEKGPTFREKIYGEYKANRDNAPEEINRQTPLLIDLLKNLGYAVTSKEGYEADDIIAYFSKQLKSKYDILIYSQDKDLLQLVEESVAIVSSKSTSEEEILFNRQRVKEKWNLYPEQIVDYLSLVGDSSDNIPGVLGIGEKTAKDLLNKYKTLDEIYNYLHTISSSAISRKLKEGRDLAYLSKQLATLNTSMDIAYDIDDFKIKPSIKKEGLELLKNYELKSVYEKLSGLVYHGNIEFSTIDNRNYHYIDTKEGLDILMVRLAKEKKFSFDTETTSVDKERLSILGASFSMQKGEAFYIDLQNHSILLYFLEKFKQVLSSNPYIIGQNIKFDYHVMHKYGIDISSYQFDTMIAARLLSDENEKINMDYLAEKYLKYKTIHYTDIVVDKTKTLADYPHDVVKDYSCEDADITYQLYELFEKKLEEEGLNMLFYTIEMPLVTILADMEIKGIEIEEAYFLKLKQEVEIRLQNLTQTIYKEAGEEFLINSTKQLQTILFEKLKYPVVKKTKTGQSTDEGVLVQLSQMGYTLASKLIEYRKLEKIRGTYIEPLLRYKHSDNRIHTTYNQTFVATGRLSSIEPNLQNIPAFDESGISIRRGFIAQSGYHLVSFDYSQIELRVLAQFCKDNNLIDSFVKNADIHADTASYIFERPLDKVSERERKIAKTINFGVLYGLSAFGLSQQLSISRTDAQAFINRYFERFAALKKYINEVVSEATANGYVTTYFRRKRYIPQLKSSNRVDKDFGARIALNTRIQGTAAEIIKLAMINIKKMYPDIRMLLQIHDELVFEINDTSLQITDSIKSIMESVMNDFSDWIIPITVKHAVGKHWNEI